MAFRSLPLFPGDLFDTALKLCSEPDAPRAAGTAHVSPSPKWQQMQELGWQGVLVAEADGGVGATLADVAALVEGAARHGSAAPLIDRCAVAPVLLTAARAHPAAAALLEALTVGAASVCPVVPGAGETPGAAATLQLNAGNLLTGCLAGVDLSEPASHLLLQARAHDEVVLVLMAWERVAERARHYVGLDARETGDCRLDGLVARPDEIVLRGPAAAPAVAAARQAGSLLACVQIVGGAAAMIELTIDYLNTRVQFGTALATFQALRHRTVEMYVAYENLSGLVRRQVINAVEQGLTLNAKDVALVKMYAASVARSVAESTIQLHGGMGMTWEMLAARLAMHALGGSLQYGSREECFDWLTAQSQREALAA